MYKISSMKLDIMRKKASGVLKVPSEKQSKILYDLYVRAEEDGVTL